MVAKHDAQRTGQFKGIFFARALLSERLEQARKVVADSLD